MEVRYYRQLELVQHSRVYSMLEETATGRSMNAGAKSGKMKREVQQQPNMMPVSECSAGKPIQPFHISLNI